MSRYINKDISKEDLSDLIEKRIKTFWGYGNLDGDIWFVGMEEGYNPNTEDLGKRYKSTQHEAVFDVYETLKNDPGQVAMFEKGGKLNRTYRRLIQILLHVKNGTEPTKEEILNFQIEKLGRKNAEPAHAFLELMPLSCSTTKTKDWLYSDFNIEGLSSRREYLKTYKPKRVTAIRSLIQEYKPKLVIFYSRTYFEDWREIIEQEIVELIPETVHLAKGEYTVYIIVPHSVAYGKSNKDWSKISETVSKVVNLNAPTQTL